MKNSVWMVYPSEVGHPSKYQPGPMLINFVDPTNIVNHYTTSRLRLTRVPDRRLVTQYGDLRPIAVAIFLKQSVMLRLYTDNHGQC